MFRQPFYVSPHAVRRFTYLMPVLRDQFKLKDAWSVVPTILLPGMEINRIHERRGWRWDH